MAPLPILRLAWLAAGLFSRRGDLSLIDAGQPWSTRAALYW